MKRIGFFSLMLFIVNSATSQAKVITNGHHTVKTGHADSLVVRKEGHYNDTLRLPFNTEISKRFYTGSVEGITGDAMVRFRTPNTANTLAGRISGLLAIQGSDEPGYSTTGLSIRGRSSYNNDAINSYVDNVPSAGIGALVFADLDPLEIDQLQVLKDGIANGIYGIKGANKSIFVTTKRGKAFDNHLDVYSSFGFEQPVALPSFVGAQKYMMWHNEARQNDGLPVMYQQSQIDAYNGSHDPYLYPDADWYGANLKNSSAIQKYDITLSGGNNAVRYFILGGVSMEAGLYKNGDANFAQYGYNTNQRYNRYNLRSNFDFSINKNLTAFVDLSARVRDVTNPGTGESPAARLFTTMAAYPSNLFPVVFQDGKIGGNVQYPNNPYGLITHMGNFVASNRITFGNVGLTQKLNMLLKGLSASGAYVFYNSFYNYQGFYAGTPSFTVYQMTNGSQQSFNRDVLPTYQTVSGAQQRISSFWGKLDYHTQWNKDNELTTVLGYAQNKRTPNREGFDFPYVTANFFNQTHYQYRSRYLLDATLSYSGAEIFPPGHRFGFFPSVGAGWILSEESFFKHVKAISFLKLRTSYALLGNSDLTNATGMGRFIYQPQYLTGQNGFAFGSTPAAAAGLAEGAVVNSNVTWENQKMFNAGIDVNMLSNTVGFSFDVFNERRERILAIPGNVSALVGQTISPLNLGVVTNHGIDASIWYAGHAGKFNYKLGANIAVNKSTIVYMSETPQPYAYLYKTGNPIGSIFGLQSLGFFNNAADIAASPKQLFSQVQPGDIKYKDQNGDGVIDNNDMVKIGNSATPTTYYGCSIDLSYKGITLSAAFQGATNYAIDLRSLATQGFYNGARPSDLMEGRWTPATAATAVYPRFSFGSVNNYQLSDFWVRNTSFIRLKSVELGYHLPSAILNRVKLKGARFYVSGFNLVTWNNTGINYVDPEAPSLGISNYPRLKNISFGLDINL